MNFFQSKIAHAGVLGWVALAAERGLAVEPGAALETFAHALWRAEGGERARVPYGVLSVKVRDAREAKAVALRSIARAAREHLGRVDERIFTPDFIEFFARRWCPPAADGAGHKNLVRNLQTMLRDRHAKKT